MNELMKPQVLQNEQIYDPKYSRTDLKRCVSRHDLKVASEVILCKSAGSPLQSRGAVAGTSATPPALSSSLHMRTIFWTTKLPIRIVDCVVTLNSTSTQVHKEWLSVELNLSAFPTAEFVPF